MCHDFLVVGVVAILTPNQIKSHLISSRWLPNECLMRTASQLGAIFATTTTTSAGYKPTQSQVDKVELIFVDFSAPVDFLSGQVAPNRRQLVDLRQPHSDNLSAPFPYISSSRNRLDGLSRAISECKYEFGVVIMMKATDMSAFYSFEISKQLTNNPTGSWSSTRPPYLLHLEVSINLPCLVAQLQPANQPTNCCPTFTYTFGDKPNLLALFEKILSTQANATTSSVVDV